MRCHSSVDNRQAWSFQKTNGVVTTVKWNHKGGNISPLPATKRIGRPRKNTRRSWVHAQSVGLNAERKICRHRAEGEIFLLTFPYIGLLQANSCVLQLRAFCFPGSIPHSIGFPPIKQPLALEAEALAFVCPRKNGAEKGDIFMSYLIVSWNRFGKLCFELSHFLGPAPLGLPLALPGTEACGAVGGAFRP